jgi:hypothetical protein
MTREPVAGHHGAGDEAQHEQRDERLDGRPAQGAGRDCDPGARQQSSHEGRRDGREQAAKAVAAMVDHDASPNIHGASHAGADRFQ